MSELSDFIKIAKRVIKIENDNSTKPNYSQIFEFPFTDDYCKWINSKSKYFKRKGRKPNYFWNDFYVEIIERQFKPAGVKIPDEWYQKIITFVTRSVYLIADSSEKLLYIGKCNFPPVIRLLDRLIPKDFNPGMNNVPQIWEDYLSQGEKVKCVYFYDLSFDPEILEYYLLNEYKIQNNNISSLYNKRMPNKIFLDKVQKIRTIMKQ